MTERDTIRTRRLVMRRAVATDLDAFHAMMTDPETMRFWSTPPHTELSQTRDWLAAMISAPAATSDDYVVEHDGRVIGKLGAWRMQEVGFMLAREFWGRGLATEALAAFVGHAFADRTDHLEADVDSRNAASLALLSRAGFSETGRAARTFQVGAEWCDSVYLRLDR